MAGQPGLPSRDEYDVVVIGSGAGGTSSAALLAKAGLSVLLAEQGDTPGGFAHAFHRGPYTIDPAVHLIADEGLYDALLRHLGVRDRCTFIRPDVFSGAIFPEFLLQAPLGPVEVLIEAYGHAFPQSAGEIRGFFELCETMHREAHELPAALGFDKIGEAVERYPTLFAYRRTTMADALDQLLGDPKVRAACFSPGALLGLAPSKLPFMLFAQFLVTHLVEGGFFCQGGAQELVNAILKGFEAAGGELLLNAPATRILVEDGRVAGVELDGARVRAPVVVSNASAIETYEDLLGPEELSESYLKAFRRLVPSVSAFILFGATSADLAALEVAHTTFVSPTWDCEAAFQASIDGKRGGGWFLMAPTVVDPSLAPPGEHIFTVVSFRPYEIDRPWHEERERYTELILEELGERLPELREGLIFSDTATPVTLERFTRATRGAIYGWENTMPHQGSRRPTQRSPIPGLYLAGHWTRPGLGFLRATTSGIYASDFVLTDLGVEAGRLEYAALPPAE